MRRPAAVVTCDLCEVKGVQDHFLIGLKEAYTQSDAAMFRVCEKCYGKITDFMIFTKKSRVPASDIRPHNDKDFLSGVGIKS